MVWLKEKNENWNTYGDCIFFKCSYILAGCKFIIKLQPGNFSIFGEVVMKKFLYNCSSFLGVFYIFAGMGYLQYLALFKNDHFAFFLQVSLVMAYLFSEIPSWIDKE